MSVDKDITKITEIFVTILQFKNPIKFYLNFTL